MEPDFDHAGETAYDGLLSAENDARWAYGTGFEDPLDGVDTTLPPDVDTAALAQYCLALGDDALIMSQSLQHWMSRLPELEEEAAVANIALDLLGQARLLLARAGLAEDAGRTEDDLAYLRPASAFTNVPLAELADPDFAHLVARLLVFSLWRAALLSRLRGSGDGVLAAVAAKGAKEVAYHVDYAVHWTLRLGDGTAVSHTRMQAALDAVWPHVGGLFAALPGADVLAGVAASADGLQADVLANLAGVLGAATLVEPRAPVVLFFRGDHTDGFEAFIDDMQSVARSLPGGVW
jgi:ring-1,2-phenylacetyl-CoA epoxidase subunit PaaC